MYTTVVLHTAAGDETYTVAHDGFMLRERTRLWAETHNMREETKKAEDPSYVPDLWTVTDDEDGQP